MSLLTDQRTMQGAAPHETPEHIRAFWERSSRRPLIRSRKKLTAYVSDGRWVADCRECGGGVALWRENPEAACLDCGAVYSSIEWPGTFDEIERVLAARRPGQRHWRPQDGETLADLKVDNLIRGVAIEAPVALEPGVDPGEVERIWRETMDGRT